MKRNLIILLLLLATLLTSCLPANSAAQPANIPVETIVAATYAAISAQTQAAMPPASPTPLNTATPTTTSAPPTETLTPTATFVIYTATPMPTSTPLVTKTSIPPTPADFQCTLLRSTPENGTVMGPKHGFDWMLKLSNSGNEDWSSANVDWVYISGDKFFQVREYNLWKDVPAGKNIEIGVDIEAPKQPGSYSTTWGLRRDTGELFCGQTLRIVVK